MILSEARGLQLFSVIRGGIGLTRRLGAGLQHTVPDRVFGFSPSNRSIARTDWLPPRHENLGITWVLFDAQAACVFSCSTSKRSSFSQRVKVMAAILRARVRRAISGFMPLASKAA